jgi:hypothetical protein
MSETRKIAAILVSDVVGYSRLAGADEDRTLARLRALRSDLIDPTIAVHHGRIVKRTGDGSVIEFRSVVDAVRCAIEVTLGVKPSNASMLDGQRPLARETVCAAYAQVGRTVAIKASPFAARVYMRRSTAGDGCEAESLLAERDRPPSWGSVMVGAGSPSRLDITHNNSHIIKAFHNSIACPLRRLLRHCVGIGGGQKGEAASTWLPFYDSPISSG